MTAAERLLWNRLQRRVTGMTPEMAAAIMLAFLNVRDAMTEAEIIRAIQLGGAERLFQEVLTDAVLAVAYAPVREKLRTNLVTSVRAYSRVIPRSTSKTITLAFDFLNPRVIDAIRELETRVITNLDDGIRETVREAVAKGLREGTAPRTVARGLRGVSGLAPNQLQEVQNFRDALLKQNGRSLADYTRRNMRYDRLARSGEITAAQVDRAVATYTKSRIALNAETSARTAALDAQKLAQRMSWQDAIDKGIVDGDRLMHQWIGVDDDRERDSHRAMNNEVRPWDQPYSNGQLVPGVGEYNCRCIDRFFVARG